MIEYKSTLDRYGYIMADVRLRTPSLFRILAAHVFYKTRKSDATLVFDINLLMYRQMMKYVKYYCHLDTVKEKNVA